MSGKQFPKKSKNFSKSLDKKQMSRARISVKSVAEKIKVTSVLAEMKNVRVRSGGRTIPLAEYATGLSGNPRSYYKGRKIASVERALAKVVIPSASNLVILNAPRRSTGALKRVALGQLRGLKARAKTYTENTKDKIIRKMELVAKKLGFTDKKTKLFIGSRSKPKHVLRNRLVLRQVKSRRSLREFDEKKERLAKSIVEKVGSRRDRLYGSFRVNYEYAVTVRASTRGGGLSESFEPYGGSKRLSGHVDIFIATAPAGVVSQIQSIIAMNIDGFGETFRGRLSRFSISYPVDTSSAIGEFVEEEIMASLLSGLEDIRSSLKRPSRESFEFDGINYSKTALVLRRSGETTSFSEMGFGNLQCEIPIIGPQPVQEQGVNCAVAGLDFFTCEDNGRKKHMFARYTRPMIQAGFLTICGKDCRTGDLITPKDVVAWSAHQDGGRNKFSHTFIAPGDTVLDCSVHPSGARIHCIWVLRNGHFYVGNTSELRASLHGNGAKRSAVMVECKKTIKTKFDAETKVDEVNVYNLGVENICKKIQDSKAEVVVLFSTPPEDEEDPTIRRPPMLDVMMELCGRVESLPMGTDWPSGQLVKFKFKGLPLVMMKTVDLIDLKRITDEMNKINPVRERFWLEETMSGMFEEFIGDRCGEMEKSSFCREALTLNAKYHSTSLVLDFKPEEKHIFSEDDVVALDVNRDYTACMAAPADPWPIYKRLDEIVPYDVSNPLHSSLSVGKVLLKRDVHGAIWMHVCRARALMDYGHITHDDIRSIYLPSYTKPRSFYTEAISEWLDLDISERMKKNGPNYFVGTNTRRFGRKLKYVITNSYSEYETLLYKNPGLKMRKSGDFHFCFNVEEWVLEQNMTSMAFLVKDQSAARQIHLIRLGERAGAIPLGIKTDCSYFKVKDSSSFVSKIRSRRDYRIKVKMEWGAIMYCVSGCVYRSKERDGTVVTPYGRGRVIYDPLRRSGGLRERKVKKYLPKKTKKAQFGDLPGQLKVVKEPSKYSDPSWVQEKEANFKEKAIRSEKSKLGWWDAWTRRVNRDETKTIVERCDWVDVNRSGFVEDFQRVCNRLRYKTVVGEIKNKGLEYVESLKKIAEKKMKGLNKAERLPIKKARAELKRISDAKKLRDDEESVRIASMSVLDRYQEKLARMRRERVKGGGFVTGPAGTGKSRLLSEMLGIANKNGLKVLVVAFKGASTNNLIVNGVEASTIDSYLDTKIGAEKEAVFRSALRKIYMKENYDFIFLDEYGELPVRHAEMICRLGEYMPVYFFGDHEQAAPSYEARLYEYRKKNSFRRSANCLRLCLEYDWSLPEGWQRCDKGAVEAMDYVRKNGKLDFDNYGLHKRMKIEDNFRLRPWQKPGDEEIKTYEWIDLDVIDRILELDIDDREFSYLQEIYAKTDKKIYKKFGKRFLRQEVLYWERGQKGGRIHPGTGHFTTMWGVNKSLLCYEHWFDFDQSASHQRAILHVISKYGIKAPFLSKYVDPVNKKRMRQEIADFYTTRLSTCSAEAAKGMVNSITYGASLKGFGNRRKKRTKQQTKFLCEHWPMKEGESPEVARSRRDAFAAVFHSKGPHEYLVAMKNERDEIIRQMSKTEEFKEARKAEIAWMKKQKKKIRDGEDGERQVNIRVLSALAQRVERRVTLCVFHHVGKENVNGIIHDGLHVSKDWVRARGLNEESACEYLEKMVLEKTGIVTKLEVKPFCLKKAKKWVSGKKKLDKPRKYSDLLFTYNACMLLKTKNFWDKKISEEWLQLHPEHPRITISGPKEYVERRKNMKNPESTFRLDRYVLCAGMRVSVRQPVLSNNALTGQKIRINNSAMGHIVQVFPDESDEYGGSIVVDWDISADGPVRTLISGSQFFWRCQLDYCVTVKRLQGRTINSTLRIWDTDLRGNFRMSRNDLVMAMSRCRKASQIKIQRFKHPLAWVEFPEEPQESKCTLVEGRIVAHGDIIAIQEAVVDDGKVKYNDDAVPLLLLREKNKKSDKFVKLGEFKKSLQDKPWKTIVSGVFSSRKRMMRLGRSLMKKEEDEKMDKKPVIVKKHTNVKLDKTILVTVDRKRKCLRARWWQVQFIQKGDHCHGVKTKYKLGSTLRKDKDVRFAKCGLKEAEKTLLECSPRGYKIKYKNAAPTKEERRIWKGKKTQEN